MKERPIIFSTAMVQAILDDRKNQTRRVINPQPTPHHWEYMPGHELHVSIIDDYACFRHSIPQNTEEPDRRKCPYGKSGDLLYVREAFFFYGQYYWFKIDNDDHDVVYLPDGRELTPKWKPSIHMPKKYARIWLTVEDIRVERVQNISDADAIKEGVDISPIGITAKTCFRVLWNTINKPRGYGWDENPWVWVVVFSVLSTTGKPEEMSKQ